MSAVAEVVSWARPGALWLLLPWAIAVLRGWRTAARPANAASPWAAVVDAALLPHVLASAPARRSASRRVIRALLAGLLIVALAGPQLPRPGAHAPLPHLRPDAARVLLIDLSPAFDALPDDERVRLRADLRRFARALPPGETALVVAAREAWLVVPPTEDVAALEAFLAELSAAAVPPRARGDAPEAGLALARATLAATGARRQAIYWLRVAPLDALRATVPGAVQPVILRADAGGQAWIDAAAYPDAGTGWTASLLNLVPPPDGGRIDLGPALALLALPLAAWLARRRHRSAMPVALAAVLALAGPAADAADAADAFDAGVVHYRAGRFAAAAESFADPAAERRDPARARHNLGNALACAGRLHEALAAYDASLAVRPGDVDTLHNRDLVARLLASPEPPRGAAPPPPAPQPDEAHRAAAQWLRRPPADVRGLLARKLELESAKRADLPGGQRP